MARKIVIGGGGGGCGGREAESEVNEFVANVFKLFDENNDRRLESWGKGSCNY